MNQPTKRKRVPAWLRGLGWLAFCILSLVTVLVVARWLVMEHGHQLTREMVASQRKRPAPRVPAGATIPNQAVEGMPLSAVPYFGSVFVEDEERWKEFEKKQLGEIRGFFRYKRVRSERVDGVWSFRAILQNKGIDVPETMTEAEAAAEYLKQTSQFSDLLAQWKEAVAKGPLDRALDLKSDPNIWRFGTTSSYFSQLMNLTALAHLQTGWCAPQELNHLL